MTVQCNTLITRREGNEFAHGLDKYSLLLMAKQQPTQFEHLFTKVMLHGFHAKQKFLGQRPCGEELQFDFTILLQRPIKAYWIWQLTSILISTQYNKTSREYIIKYELKTNFNPCNAWVIVLLYIF